MGEETVIAVAPASESTTEESHELSSKGEKNADPVLDIMFEEFAEKAALAPNQEKGLRDGEVEEKTGEWTTEAKEKTVESAAEHTFAGGSAQDESPSQIAEDYALVPLKEESYSLSDLKESEKNTLQAFKAKIEKSINENFFFDLAKSAKRLKKDAGKKGAEAQGSDLKGKADVNEKSEVAGDSTSSIEVSEPESPLPLSVEPSEVGEDAGSFEEQTELSTTEARDSSIEMNGEWPFTNDAVIEPEESPSLYDLSLWGVSLVPSKGDERLDVILLKFLRARSFKLNSAFTMLQKTMIWRKQFKADTLVDEEIATNEFDSVAYMHGYDKEGHPVCYNHFGVFQDKELRRKTFDDDGELNRFLRWRIQLLEKGIQQLDFKPGGVNSMVQVTDLENFPGLLKRRNITKKFVSLLQEYYPEMVATQIIINVPWYFGALYSLPGMTVTRRLKKTVLARPHKVVKTLFRYISPEFVPSQYGGLSRPNDTEFEDEVPVRKAEVKAGEKQTIELPVNESGMRVIWDVAVVGWDVVYGEEFVPSGEGSDTVIILKSKKIDLPEETKRNSFKVNEPGNVVITIDNTGSKKNRLAWYRYISKEVPSAAS